MTDRELMQEVLQVLEFNDFMRGSKPNVAKLIAALRDRLAHPVQFKCTIIDDEHPDGVPLSKWGRHSEQEPFCYHDGRNIVGKEYADHSDVFPLYTAPPPRQPLTDREVELLDGMIEVQLDHAKRCESIANRPMAEKQKAWDMERVELLRKLKAAHGIRSDDGRIVG
jgi:hypothetical protein